MFRLHPLRGARVLIRADASQRIGTGHVMRCLSLAAALKRYGSIVTFACRDLPGLPAHRIVEAGFHLIRLRPDAPDIDAPSSGLRQHATLADVVVVDHYGIDATWERAMKRSGQLMVAVDDLANRAHDVDLLVDSTLGRSEPDYEALLPPECAMLLGPQYAIVDQRFHAARARSLERRASAPPPMQQLVVSLGGADPSDANASVLRSLGSIDLPASVEITVVLGPAVTQRDAIERACTALARPIRILFDVRDMPTLLSETDLVIGAGGTSAWERCCLGVPTALLVLAPNQAEGARALESAGAAVLIGGPEEIDGRLAPAIMNAMAPPTLRRLSHHASQLCDGLGAQRVVESIAAVLRSCRGPS